MFYIDKVLSLETQQSRLSLLRASHKIWLSKTHESRDAVHASKVLGAILRRVESKTAGSSEDITMGVRTSRQLPTPVSTIGSNGASNGQSQESDNVDDMMQLDDFFANQGDLDWVSLPSSPFYASCIYGIVRVRS